jgi:polysaccharide pyruvyl transferase WcaK-like protein
LIEVAGGWGYENLGDEAILAGYVEHLQLQQRVRVLSVNPKRTMRAQLSGVVVARETTTSHSRDSLVIGGGGYLNGRWLPEIYPKLTRLAALSRNRSVTVHGVEVRRMDNRVKAGLIRRFLEGADVTVRDAKSAANVAAITGATPQVVPDAIALLVPHLERYQTNLPWLTGKIVLNLLDISGRGDADECEIDAGGWDHFVQSLLTRLGQQAVILVGGEGDRVYANKFKHNAAVIEPTTVSGLVSILGSARGVLSVRMHPGLLASAVGTPVVTVPYCGKVRPTLEEIGVGAILMQDLNVESVLDRLHVDVNFDHEWRAASISSAQHLDRSLDPD